MSNGINKLKNLKTAKVKPVAETGQDQPIKETGQDQPIKAKNSGLMPKRKSPERIAEDNSLKEAIISLLKGNKEGASAVELRLAIFEDVSEDEIKSTERKIRAFCRGLGCVPNPIEGTRSVRYTL